MAPENSVAASIKRRRRPAVACERCRQRKIKCDTQSPCNNCTKARNQTCTYVSTHVPKSRTSKAQQTALAETRTSPVPLAPKSVASSADYIAHSFESFPGSSSSPSNTQSSIATPATTASHSTWPAVGANQISIKQSQGRALGFRSTGCPLIEPSATAPPIRGSVSKTRYFGQSHWMNGASMFPKELGTLVQEETEQGELFQALHKCKLLGRKLKAHRLQPILSTQLGENMPSRQDADMLIQNYIDTFEGIVRIIHIPTFRSDYERYWQDISASSDSLIMLIKLCMALGSTVCDNSDAWKATAMQWVREAQVWLMLPPEKSRLTLQGIQIMCLVLLCKSVVGLGQDLTWVLAGSVVRNAMYMGLHRDPKHLAEMTTYAAEMRRRLWATIMELNLQFAAEAGGMPLISELDYDTELPANLDDEQLNDEIDKTRTSPPPESALTQSTISIELAKSLPFRLRLVTEINNFRSIESYDRTLELNTALTEICQEFSTKMNSLIGKKPSAATKAPINTCHVLFGEMLLYRCFHTLHMPVVTKAFDDPKYYFSRQICVSSALKLSSMWGFKEPRDTSELLAPGVASFRRLAISGTGMFRNIPALSLFILSRELLEQRNPTSSGLGLFPVATNHDLRVHLRSFEAWSLERIKAGETSVKEHCFITALLAHTDALSQRLDAKAISKFMLEKCTESATLTLSILTELAEKSGVMGESTNVGDAQDNDADMGGFNMDWNGGLDWENGSLWKSGWWHMNIMPNLDDFNPGVYP